MLSAQWQDLQDPETSPADPNEGKYRYNGRFEDNSQIRGSWKLVGQVDAIDEFNGAVTTTESDAIVFYSGGKTNDPNRL